MTVKTQIYSSPAGDLIIGDCGGCLCLCDWTCRKNRKEIDERLKRLLNAEFENGETAVIQETFNQLDEYFSGIRNHFDLTLKMAGTEFQKRVWSALMSIGYGERISYSSLAANLGNAKSVRAVANSVGANPISIIVPCHRVVGTDNSMVGYAGGIEAKKFLLDLERDFQYGKKA